MAVLWNDIACGFDTGEETANFGTRAVALSDGCIYESSTLATIKPQEDVIENSYPVCKSFSHGCFFAVTVDSSLVIFKDDFSVVLLRIHFDDRIDQMEFSDDGEFVFVGLHCSTLICIHVPSKTSFILSKCLNNINAKVEENGNFFNKIAVINSSDEEIKCLIIDCTMRVIKICGLSLKKIRECCDLPETEEKNSMVQQIVSGIIVDCLHGPINFGLPLVVAPNGLDKNDTNDFIYLVGNQLNIWSNSRGSERMFPIDLEGQIKKIAVTPCGKYCLGLLDSGSLFVICLKSWILLGVFENNILDFVLLNNLEEESRTSVVALEAGETTMLSLIHFPGFEKVYSLKVGNNCFLVENLSSENDVHYIEGSGESFVNALSIKCAVASFPEHRLERLLRRGKFNEAEEFARLFSLNLEGIYKAKAIRLSGKLQFWHKGNEEVSAAEFEDLKKLIDKIEDIDFVVGLCQRAVFADIYWVQDLYEYAAKRLKKVQGDSKYSVLIDTFGSMFVRLETFFLLNYSHTPEMWLHFSSTDLISECQNLLANGDMESAVIVFTKHEKTFLSSMTSGLGLSLLKTVPHSVPFESLIYWLRKFIPGLLTAHPFLFKPVIEWLTEKISSPESLSCDDGPESALKLSKQFLDIIRPLLIDQSDIPTVMDITSFDRLPHLIGILEKLVHLKVNHKILAPFELFMAEKSESNCHNLMCYLFDSVPYNGIGFLITDFAMPYCSEQSVRCDDIIRTYIEKCMGEINWLDSTNQLMELHAISFINCIQSIKEKLEGVIFFLNHATVPWSSEVSSLAEEATRWEHSLAKEVFKIKIISMKKMILKNYNLPINKVNFSDTHKIVEYILTHRHDGAMDDAIKFVSWDGPKLKTWPYEVYMQQCLENGNVKKAFSYITKDLSENDQIRVLDSTKYHLRILADLSHDLKIENIADFQVLSERIMPGSDDTLNNIKASLFIESMYGVKATPSMLISKEDKLSVARNVVQKILPVTLENKSFIQANKEFETLIKRGEEISSTLRVPLVAVIFEMVREATTLNFLMIASALISHLSDFEEIHEFSKETEDVVFKILQKYDSTDINHLPIARSAKKLVDSSFHCSMANMNKMIELKNIIDVLNKPSMPPPEWVNQYYDTVSNPLPSVSKEFLGSLLSVVKRDQQEVLNVKSIKKEEGTPGALSGYNSDQLIYSQFCDFMQNSPIEVHSYTSAAKLIWFLSSKILTKKEHKKIITLTMPNLSNVLMKIVSSRNLDLHLAVSLLHFFLPDQATIWLHNVSSRGTDMKRQMNVALLGRAYCQFHKLPEAMKYHRLYNKSIWDRRLRKYGMQSSVDAYDDDDKKEGILLRLMNVPNMELTILNQFCSDLQYDHERCLFIYIEHILLSWKLEFTVANVGESVELKIKNDVESLEDLCWQVAINIRDVEGLVKYLRLKVWEKVSRYHYEVFSVLIMLIERLQPDSFCFINEKMLISFLMSYIRVVRSSPTEVEMKMWSNYGFECLDSSSIAQYRLPFLPVKSVTELEDFLKFEFTIDTYKKWIGLNSWFDIPFNKNIICLFSIHNLKKGVFTSSAWELQMKNQDLLQQIDDCVSNITDPEIATTALYFVANHVLPPGADQLDAIQRCQIKALEWSTIDKGENVQKSLARVNNKYLLLSTTHLLHKYKLAKPEYLELVLRPNDLINALYYDSSIVESFQGLKEEPRINDVVERICSVHDVSSIVDLRRELLMRWLQSEPSNQSFLEESLVPQQIPTSMLNENLMRICYMMKGYDFMKAGSLLNSYVFSRGQVDSSKPTLPRLRALTCLLNIIPPDHLVDVTGRDYFSLMKHLELLKILYQLELVGLYYTEATFEVVSKEELVTILLRTPTREAVSVAAEICSSYKIHNPDVWLSILNHMMALKMVDVLEKYLFEINELFVHLMDRDIILKAWKTVLCSSLSKADGETSHIDHCLFLLNVCPVLAKLDLEINFRINNPDIKEKISNLLERKMKVDS